MRHQLYVSLMLIAWSPGFSQTPKLQHLKQTLQMSASRDARLLVLSAICEEAESMPPDSLLYYAEALHKTAEQPVYMPGLLAADYFTAYSLYRKNKTDSAKNILTRQQDVFGRIPQWDNAARLLIAKCVSRQQQYAESLSICYGVLNHAEKENDTLNQIRAMAGIGSALTRTGDFSNALQWFLKGIHLSAGTNFQYRCVYLYTNAAVIFNRKEQYDSSLIYVQKAIGLARTAENLTDLANALGMYAAQLMDSNGKEMDAKKYTAAERPLLEALDVARQMGDPNDIITNMGTLGVYYSDTNIPKKGIAICEEALKLIDRYGLVLKRPYMYDILALNYGIMGDYKHQAEALQKMADSRDTVYQYNSAEAMSALKTKYDVQKKENTIIRQQLELVKKDYLLYTGVAIFVIAVIAGWIGFRLYKRKQKRRARNAIALAEEKERRRIAADLHDNLGAYAASIASNLDRLYIQEGIATDSVLAEVRNNSNAIVSELSDTIWALKKETLNLTAVSDRLKVFIQRIEPSYPGISYDIFEEIATDHQLSAGQGFHLFQTLQEAITNALKHSNCRAIRISITSQPDEWQITIRDNGIGLNATTSLFAGMGGNGLQNMQSRAEQGGWHIEWHNHPDGGLGVLLRMTNMS